MDIYHIVLLLQSTEYNELFFTYCSPASIPGQVQLENQITTNYYSTVLYMKESFFHILYLFPTLSGSHVRCSIFDTAAYSRTAGLLSGIIRIHTCSKNSHQKSPGWMIRSLRFTLVIRAKI